MPVNDYKYLHVKVLNDDTVRTLSYGDIVVHFENAVIKDSERAKLLRGIHKLLTQTSSIARLKPELPAKATVGTW